MPGTSITSPSSLASACLRGGAEPLKLLLRELEHVGALERARPPGDLDRVDDIRVPEQDRQRDQHSVGGRVLEHEAAGFVSDRLAEIGLYRAELERPLAEVDGRLTGGAVIRGRDEDRVDHAAHEGFAAPRE